MKQDWIDIISQYPRNKGFWEFSILPHLGIAYDPGEGIAIGFGWLFWTVIIYIAPWE